MAYEAVESLQQTLLLILQRHDDHVITPTVKQQIVSIHDKAVVLQFNLNHFPEKETIREVANTAEEIIQYLFSQQNLSVCGSIEPSVRLSDQLGKLAKELDSTVGYVVDYCSSDSFAVSSSSKSALKSEIKDLTVATELIAINLIQLKRLAEKMKSTAGELADEDVVAGFDDDLDDSAAVAPTSKDPEVKSDEDQLVIGSNDDVVEIIDRITDGSPFLQILPIIEVGGIGESTLAKYIYDHQLITVHFIVRVWVTISQDDDIASILSKLLASVRVEVGRLGKDRLKGIEADQVCDEIYIILYRWRYLIVMDGMWSAEAWDHIRWCFPEIENGSRIVLTTRLMDVATYAARQGGILMMPFLDDGQRWRTTNKDLVVGFHEDIQQLMDRLVRDDKLEIQTLPIFGMGGIGKSTLAKTVYENQWIQQHFDICVWVTVSQDYSIESIVSQLLASLKGKVDRVGRDSLKVIENQEVEIYKILWERRYLIVMDDIWSVEAWDNARRLFPENYNGSKIILTTRLMDVATYAAPLSNVHTMRFMDEGQSWRLFRHKVFGDKDFPYQLFHVGKKIVKECGGLPLSIVTVAGLLSRIPRTAKLWQEIEINDGQLGLILSLSYDILPTHLRKCFLYMAGFPQDYEIHASELIKLWVAEGFLECRNESKSVEVVAEECLEDLIKQSLVLVTSRKIDGKIKSCRLHSMVWDFCVRQARQEKFLLSVTDYFPNLILRKQFLPQVLQNHPRISVSWHDLRLIDSKHSSCTTSIICIPQRGYRPKGSVENFTSLRVLHVLRRNDRSYWELGQVFELIYLTYLASNIPDSIVPPAIAKLQQ